MGALPSRESNEDPSSVFFANCGSHIVFHIPLTHHYFNTPDSLAFRQLHHARNSQSALYCVEMKDVSSVMPEGVAEAFRAAQEEDWGEEVEEADPSLHYCDEEIDEKILEYLDSEDATCGDTHASVPRSQRVGRHLRPSIEDRNELYRVLVTEPTEGTLVDTDREMCALVEQEHRWRAALSNFFSAQEQRRHRHCNRQSRGKNDCIVSNNGDADDALRSTDASARQKHDPTQTLGEDDEQLAANASCVAESTVPSPPSPPLQFLYPLPQAIALRMTTEEEEEMRSEYCRKHSIPYVAPTFHDVSPTADRECSSQENRHAAPRTVLPVVQRRHYHFEDDPQYRDGRVHLVEEHGVLYHFAYFTPRQSKRAASVASDDPKSGEARGSSAVPSTVLAVGTTPISQTPIVLGRCLHDVVYCETPTHKSDSLSSTSGDGCASSAASYPGHDPVVVPPVRYGWCARCGERVTQRMDYTKLRRLKSTRAYRRTAWEGLSGGDLNSLDENDDMDDVASHTKRVDEEGEEEFIINITPVRVVGMNGFLPSRCRGTQWLRGCESASEAAGDAWVEQLERKPPTMRLCRFIEGSVGDKIVNRATLVSLLSYRPMCRQAGLKEALIRPAWTLCVLSNIPYLQMVRETFFRAKAAVAEVDDGDVSLRDWLNAVDRENNFYNFINANLYMIRNSTPPERVVRQREQTDDAGNKGTAAHSKTGITGFRGGEGPSIGACPANAPAKPTLLNCKAAFPARAAPDPSPWTPSDATCTSADTSRATADAATQGASSTRDGKPGEDIVENDGCGLRSHRLTRTLEEVTIGRPEGQGPCDPEEEEEEEEEDDDGDDDDHHKIGDEWAADKGAVYGDTAATPRSEVKSPKKTLQQKHRERLPSTFSSASMPPHAEGVSKTGSDRRGVMVSKFGGTQPRHASEGEGCGEPSASRITAARTQPNAATACAAAGMCEKSETEGLSSLVKDTIIIHDSDNDDDDDLDFCMEEEERGRGPTSLTGTFPHKTSTASDFYPQRSAETARIKRGDEQHRPPHPAELPPRPNFHFFSSRLELHPPMSLGTLFDDGTSADRAAKQPTTQRADAASGNVFANLCAGAGAPASTSTWPSDVQHDVLRENERRRAEPEATRGPCHALDECGMLATTRGRHLLFFLREDCLRMLLYYSSVAAAPIFIGAYIEPVDTTSISYGGAVRLQRASSPHLPLDDSYQSDDGRSPTARYDAAQRVVIEPVGEVEVMAEYFNTQKIITCFSIADVEKLAPGPSAGHRLRKMILSSSPSRTQSDLDPSSCGAGAAQEWDSLAAQQARELATYGQVLTYAADEFCDGDLVVFDFEHRRWEHYEYVQLRRRFSVDRNAESPSRSAEGGVPAPAATTDVAASDDGSLSCNHSVRAIASLSARLLWVGLDELLLSWTKWVVDNRFYEDRTDLGWLRLPDGSPVQMGGRYFIWSFRHNNQRYFYGVIPKFAKGRMRRQRLHKRHRSKRKRNAALYRLQVEEVAVRSSTPSTPLPVTTTTSAAAAAAAASQDSSGAYNALEAQPDGARPRAGDAAPKGNCSPGSPSDAKQPPSFPRHPGPSSPPSAGTCTSPKRPLPHEPNSSLAAAQLTSATVDSVTHPTPARRCQPHASAHIHSHHQPAVASVPMPHCLNTSAPIVRVGSAPARTWGSALQGNLTGPLRSSGSLPTRHLSCNTTPPTLYHSATAPHRRRSKARRPRFISPSSLQPVESSRHHADGCISSVSYLPGQPEGLRGAPNYYYQYGGNTFIQDGKQCENVYYPPLPMHPSFHPSTAPQNLVPLPHPQTQRGGIPAIFRFWGPIGSPVHRPPAAPSFSPNASGTVAMGTASWATLVTSQIHRQLRLFSHQHLFTGPPIADGAAAGEGGSIEKGEMNIPGTYPHSAALHVVTNSSISVPTIVPASVTTPARASSRNLTVRLRRRARGGSPAAIGAISVSDSTCVAPLQTVSHGTPLTATGSATPLPHRSVASSSFPTTPLFSDSMLMPLLVDDSGSRRLSPTSMLPANLVNEGSKTKGESVLRVEEDKYMQREAFRWNPYASTKWAQGHHGGPTAPLEVDWGNSSS